jgi:hypothetical protein
MKRYFIGTLLVTSMFLTTSCTEEVKGNLKQLEKKTVTTEPLPYKYFQITVDNSDTLSYKIHEAESILDDCYQRTQTEFDADNPITIDCIVEAEELDLYYRGATLNAKADPGLCEAMVSEPYRFYLFEPGVTLSGFDTSALGYPETIADLEAAAAVVGNTEIEYTCDAACLDAKCDTTVQFGNPVCGYDHSQRTDLRTGYTGPNCDIGILKTYTVSLDAACEIADEGSISENETECGGKVGNCFAGAGNDWLIEQSIDPDIYSGYVTYVASELDEINVNMELKSPFASTTGGLPAITNAYIANFTKQCSSSVDISTVDFTTLTDYDTDYISTTVANQSVGVLADFSAATSYNLASNLYNGIKKAHPYYTFTCVDKAFDPKAIIRVSIREWDRSFTDFDDNTGFQLISDEDDTAPIMNDNSYNAFADLEDLIGASGLDIFNDTCAAEDNADTFIEDAL